MTPRSESSDFADTFPVAVINDRRAENPCRPVGGSAKRLLDIVVALIALCASLPVLVLIAILIRTNDSGPVIFAHLRIGFGGKPFKCYKFRTMRLDAEGALEAYLADNPQAAEEWRASMKLRRDPRVTFLGRILRSSSLDELPQLVNVLLGQMSCVGPRPVVADELARYGVSVSEYLRARPGVTGLWQVSGRSGVDYSQRVLMDSYYVQHWSLRSDLIILARTVFAVLRFDETC